MEPKITETPFDFFGCYIRISEDQKYKYAEEKLTMYYKDLVEEALRHNEQLKFEVQALLDVNKKYMFNEEQVKEAIADERRKRSQLKTEMDLQKEEYEKKIAEIIGQRFEEKLDMTHFYTKKIELLETELKTSY